MILIVILSIILIWLHVSSLRFIIKSNTDQTIIEEARRFEEEVPKSEGEFSLKSGPGIVSLAIIILLNLIELGYFLVCVYLFNNFIVVLGSSVLAGYTIYSVIRFIPSMKKFYNKPTEYLKERTTGIENVLSFIMTSLEIMFCIYVLVLAIIEFKLFELL